MERNKQLKLMVIIVDRSKTEKIVASIKTCGANYEHVLLGKGTASSDLLSVLGLGSTEKSVILTTARQEDVSKIQWVLKDKFNFDSAGSGVSFTVDVASIGGPVSKCILSGEWSMEENV